MKCNKRQHANPEADPEHKPIPLGLNSTQELPVKSSLPVFSGGGQLTWIAVSKQTIHGGTEGDGAGKDYEYKAHHAEKSKPFER